MHRLILTLTIISIQSLAKKNGIFCCCCKVDAFQDENLNLIEMKLQLVNSLHIYWFQLETSFTILYWNSYEKKLIIFLLLNNFYYRAKIDACSFTANEILPTKSHRFFLIQFVYLIHTIIEHFQLDHTTIFLRLHQCVRLITNLFSYQF